MKLDLDQDEFIDDTMRYITTAQLNCYLKRATELAGAEPSKQIARQCNRVHKKLRNRKRIEYFQAPESDCIAAYNTHRTTSATQDSTSAQPLSLYSSESEVFVSTATVT